MPFTTGHAATAAIAILGTVVAVRGPWTNASATAVPQPATYVDQYGRAVQLTPIAQPTGVAAPSFVSVPAAAPVAAPATYAAPVAPRVATRPMAAPVYEPLDAPAAPVVQRAPVATRTSTADRQKRSWKKSAVIIGGSAGAGAGVGALIGGKKGAGIGAAIGGGGAALIEALRR